MNTQEIKSKRTIKNMEKVSDKIANRQSISQKFNTDDLTTHRILQNLNFGFFSTHFGDDASKKWEEAHPFFYKNHPSINYHEFSLDFIEIHFDLFSKNQFWTSAGWELNSKTNLMEWTYKSGYRTIKNNVNILITQ